MAKSYLTSAELDALAPATDEQIGALISDCVQAIVENDIDDREHRTPQAVVILQMHNRLEQAETALLSLLYQNGSQPGRWLTGVIGDTDVTDEVGPAADLAMGPADAH